MHYKHFTLAIIYRLLTIAILSGACVYFVFIQKTYALAAVLLLIDILFFTNTIMYFNKINRWISFFLLGIENEDTTLKIPRKTGNKVLDDVFKGMDRLNELFKQTKIEISTQEQYYRSVINQSATGLFSVDEHGRVINLNPAAAKLTRLIQYHHINTLTRIDKSLPNFLTRKKIEKEPISAIYENEKGQKLLFKVSEIETQKQVIKLVAVSDITKELDNREVDAWIKLARTLSHEIMNNIAPITTLSSVIHNYFVINNKTIEVDQLEQKTIDNTSKGLKVIEERSNGLLNFVDNYRKFTKLPEPKITTIDLSETIKKVLTVCSGFPLYNASEIINLATNAFCINTDEDLLNQVLINLIKNALEAQHESKNRENANIKLKSYREKDFVKLEIINTGDEIPPEIREQIFVPFFTTKENGSGIGLSLSKQIMLKMGGDLNLIATNENHTSFCLTFHV